MTYALGRSVDYDDMPTVRKIVRDASARRLAVFVDRLGDRAKRAVPEARRLPAIPTRK